MPANINIPFPPLVQPPQIPAELIQGQAFGQAAPGIAKAKAAGKVGKSIIGAIQEFAQQKQKHKQVEQLAQVMTQEGVSPSLRALILGTAMTDFPTALKAFSGYLSDRERTQAQGQRPGPAPAEPLVGQPMQEPGRSPLRTAAIGAGGGAAAGAIIGSRRPGLFSILSGLAGGLGGFAAGGGFRGGARPVETETESMARIGAKLRGLQ